MNIYISTAVITATLCVPLTVSAQERFAGVEYLAGRGDLPKPFEATLVLDDQALRIEQTVYSKEGRSVWTVFTIPLKNISTVGASLNWEPGSPILAGLVGGSSPTANHEYVAITMKAGDRVEAVVFRVGRQQSAGIAAKIESAVQKAQEPATTQPPRVRAAVRSRRRPLHLVNVVERPGHRHSGHRRPRSLGVWRGHPQRPHKQQA